MQSVQYRNYIFGLLLSPFITFLLALRNFGSKAARNILIIFSCFLGYFFIMPQGSDGSRHAGNVENHYANLSFGDFISEAKQLLVFQSSEGTNDDIFLHVVSYIVAFFSSSSAVFFLIISFIYSYFYIRAMGTIYDLLPVRKANYIALLFILLFLWKSFEGINTVRTWTATWIFFNGAIGYFGTGKKKYLWLVALAPMVHFVFALYSLAFWFVFVVKNRPKVYFGIFLVSVLFKYTIGNSAVFKDVIGATAIGKEKLEIYSLDDEDRLARYEQNRDTTGSSFHKKYYSDVTNAFAELLLILIIFRYGYLKGKIKEPRILGSIAIALMLWSFGNYLNVVPAVYNRGIIVAGIFILTAALLLFSKRYFDESAYRPRLDGLYNVTKILMLFVIALVGINKISSISSYMNAKLLISPLVSSWFEASISIRQIIDLIN